jgi:hypothetical protein
MPYIIETFDKPGHADVLVRARDDHALAQGVF